MFRRHPIFTENGIIEIVGSILLAACLLRCVQYAIQSDIKQGRSFWLASTLIFFTVIRRELNHLPELVIPSNLLLFNHTYEWWEDTVLIIIYVIALGLLVYAWRYLWSLLKRVPVSLYLTVTLLAILQYMGENTIVFSESVGVAIEELTEGIVYAIALWYLWTFTLSDFEKQLTTSSHFERVRQ
ncbi:hypothetical protein [Psychrobacter sp. DM4]|uniref:hypothetical protein n=1 Tax=Psychrobacter sp. DM4 TaxID=3440637 RepID=UPI003F502CD4